MKTITLLLSAALLTGGVTTACAQQGTGGQSLPATVSDVPDAASPVFVPDLPANLTFAGEKVPLEYAEVREALEREMTVTMPRAASTPIRSPLPVRRDCGSS